MKVLLVCGSPNEKGCTFTALSEVAGQLHAAGIDTQMLHIGAQPISGCIACGGCGRGGRCVLDGDKVVNQAIDLMQGCDGLVVGSPVYYAGPNGALTAFLDRMFFAAGRSFAHKPGAAIVSARRGGTTAALDRLNKYFQISQMPVVSSQYWGMVHGNTPQEVAQDLEGMQIMRTLGRNMAWLLKSIEAGKAAGIALPQEEPRVSTNFIR